MKKLFLLTLISLTVLNCGDDVEFNAPAFQGDRANQLWRANAFSAAVDANGYLTIVGTNNTETVTLRVPSASIGTSVFGNVNSMEAEYIDGFGTIFSTNNRPDASVSIYPEIGEIEIEEIDYTNETFTGTYRFLAFDDSGLNVVGYSRGIFFQVPLISGTIPPNPITCSSTTDDVIAAQAAYNEANSNASGFYDSTNFSTSCNTYKDALILQRIYCADLDGSIQALIDSLGDCAYPCSYANANVEEAELQYSTSRMGKYILRCNRYRQYLEEQILYCGDPNGNVQALIDALDCNDDDGDTVPNVFEDFNGNGDYNDDDTDSDLNSNYVDDDDDDDGVLTVLEVQFDGPGNPADTDGDGVLDYLDTDDDGDGLETIDEDLNGDGDPTNDDTDGDGIPNYLDADDDNDGILTVFEDLNGTINPTDDDTDGDGIPNYLDVDDDGDSVYTVFELFEDVVDGNPSDAQDFDADGILDYLDIDDDNDGILTADENPDPNGDGDPADAVNTDADVFPDYLDAE